MPELPEVETVRRALTSTLVGERVRAVWTSGHRLRERVNAKGLAAVAVDQTVVGVERRAKYLLLAFSRGGSVVVHLGMTGWLGIVEQPKVRDSHAHVLFDLGAARSLLYRDPRRFGLVRAFPTARALARWMGGLRLGLEPLAPEFSPAFFADALRRCQGPIKSVLMSNRIVVGVGNIYAAEALFRARIHPKTPANRISAVRAERLWAATRETLHEAIEEGGTTLRDFASPLGEAGMFAPRLRVYGRVGQPCVECGQPIRMTRLAGRSTYYCGRCQHT